MYEMKIEFEKDESETPVICTVEYNFIQDCDWVDHGEHGSWRDTSFVEIKKVSYTFKGQKYTPTAYEEKYWEADLEEECIRDLGEAA